MVMNLEIPVNTTAKVCLPATDPGIVKESGKILNKVNDIKIIGIENNKLAVEIGSGKYRFEFKTKVKSKK